MNYFLISPTIPIYLSSNLVVVSFFLGIFYSIVIRLSTFGITFSLKIDPFIFKNGTLYIDDIIFAIKSTLPDFFNSVSLVNMNLMMSFKLGLL